MAAGRAGAAARKTKQEERQLEQLRVAKESFRPDGTSANIPPKEADQEQAVSADKRPEHREGLTNWTPWIIGACLSGALMFLPRLRAMQMPPVAQTSGGAAAGPH